MRKNEKYLNKAINNIYIQLTILPITDILFMYQLKSVEFCLLQNTWYDKKKIMKSLQNKVITVFVIQQVAENN